MLLHIFYLYRPVLSCEDKDDEDHILEGFLKGKEWVRERWWYKLAHICRRWRCLILGSVSYLGLCLVCKNSTPVADMLAHSPPLPLIIDYVQEHPDSEFTAEDEEGFTLALEHSNRVLRIRLRMPIEKLPKLISSIDGEYPMLEYLNIRPPTKTRLCLMLSETFRAPHIRHVLLKHFAFLRGSSLLTTAAPGGLVTLCLSKAMPLTSLQPKYLLQLLAFMPQLETLLIEFLHPAPNHVIERQLLDVSATTRVTLPNLYQFRFGGISAYLEALLRWITTPRLRKLHIMFFSRLTFSVPSLLEFIETTENIQFSAARFRFSGTGVCAKMYPSEKSKTYSFHIGVPSTHLDWQVSSVAQLVNALSPALSRVEHLTLEGKNGSLPLDSEEHHEVDRTNWYEFLRSFGNVQTLVVDDSFVKEVSQSLRPDDGEHPADLLPELTELKYSVASNADGVFTSFMNARQDAGRPVALTVICDPLCDTRELMCTSTAASDLA
jgi:hypothetical protein